MSFDTVRLLPTSDQDDRDADLGHFVPDNLSETSSMKQDYSHTAVAGWKLTSEEVMNSQLRETSVVIINPQGFHFRPMAAFAELANRFVSNICILKDGRLVNGKSVWELMLLGAEQGTELLIRADGSDSDEAIEAITVLMRSPVVVEPNDGDE